MGDTTSVCAAAGFGWPQWVMLSLYVLGLVHWCVKIGRNRDISSGVAVWAIFLVIVWHSACAAVLHAGGFW